MKINWNRSIKKRQEFKDNLFDSSLLKNQANNERRIMDRNAIREYLSGNEDSVFSLSSMGNPWHWD